MTTKAYSPFRREDPWGSQIPHSLQDWVGNRSSWNTHLRMEAYRGPSWISWSGLMAALSFLWRGLIDQIASSAWLQERARSHHFCLAAFFPLPNKPGIIMRVSRHLPHPLPASPFCSITAQSPRTVEIWPATVLFLMSPRITAEVLAATPRCIHGCCSFLSEDMGRKPMPLPGVAGPVEGRPGRFSI